MEKVQVERYRSFFGKLYDDVGSCAMAEIQESLVRLLDKHSYNGMTRNDAAEMLADHADEFSAVLLGDFSGVITDQEASRVFDGVRNTREVLFDMDPPQYAMHSAKSAAMLVAKTVAFLLRTGRREEIEDYCDRVIESAGGKKS